MTFSNRIYLLLATGLGIGFAPKMPGTFGTLWGILIVGGAYLMGMPPAVAISINIVLILIGIPICAKGAVLLNDEDPGPVVWDEFTAIPITFWIFYLFPATASPYLIALLGFVWFRLFDITKPFPIKWFEGLGGGLGIMADDVVAAIFAGIGLYLSCWCFGLISV